MGPRRQPVVRGCLALARPKEGQEGVKPTLILVMLKLSPRVSGVGHAVPGVRFAAANKERLEAVPTFAFPVNGKRRELLRVQNVEPAENLQHERGVHRVGLAECNNKKRAL